MKMRLSSALVVGLIAFCGFLPLAVRAQDRATSQLQFSVVVGQGVAPRRSQSTKNCNKASYGRAECIVFHFTIRNVGDSPLISFTSDCSYSGITPEDEATSGDWKPLPELPRECVANMTHETAILPGGSIEGNFTLGDLAPGFDISSVSKSGDYRMRFVLTPWVCTADPTGDKCINEKRKMVPSTSEEIPVHVE